VSNSSNPLCINVGFLLNQPVGTSHDIPFELERLDLSSDLIFTGFEAVIRIGRTPQGMLVSGDLRAITKLECARCLSKFNQPLESEFSELYAFNRKSTTESDLILPEDANLDLRPLIREYMMLEIAINPLCRSDCRGLCPVCGENLTSTTCEHHTLNCEGEPTKYSDNSLARALSKAISETE